MSFVTTFVGEIRHLAKSLGLWQLTAIGVAASSASASSPSPGWWRKATRDNPSVGPSVLITFLIAGLRDPAVAPTSFIYLSYAASTSGAAGSSVVGSW
jgi:hypothetical protein